MKGKQRWWRSTGSDVRFQSGILKIKREGDVCWRDYNYNSGFEVTIEFRDGQSIQSNGSMVNRIAYTLQGSSLGLTDHFRLSPSLAKLFLDNHHLIQSNLNLVQTQLKSYREYFATQLVWKRNCLSYAFLLDLIIKEDHQDITSISFTKRVLDQELDPKMRAFPEICRGSLAVVEARLRCINRNPITRWWYTFFDDL